jgi:hypothetical protein
MHDQGGMPILYLHSPLPLKGFKAHKTEGGVTAHVAYARRDLYRLALVTARSRICYQGEERVIDGSFLFYAGPNAAYSWESPAQAQSGYSCLFTEAFLSRHPHLANFLQSPLFGLGDIAVCPLTGRQHQRVATIFGQILLAQDSDYVFKHELIGNCLHLLIHEALKRQPSEKG